VGIEVWFCCLPGYERNVTRALCAAFTTSLLSPIPASVYDLLWTAPVQSHDARKEAYYWYYALGRAVVIDPVTETPEEVVFILQLDFWIELIEFNFSPEGLCPEGCKRRIFAKG